MDTHKLRIMVSNMKNSNSREKLEHIRNTVLENLTRLDAAPSAAMSERPPDATLVRLSCPRGLAIILEMFRTVLTLLAI